MKILGLEIENVEEAIYSTKFSNFITHLAGFYFF